MTTDPTVFRPEVDDPRVLALAQARQQIAYESPLNFVCPPWDGLTEQEQHLSLLDARNYLHAALRAGLAPAAVSVPPPATRADNQAALRDRIRRAVCEAEGFMWNTELLEPDEYGDVADAVLAVLPEPADQAAVLNRAADFFHGLSLTGTAVTAREVETELRRLAAEAQQPDDGEGDELVCVDECGFCDACGYEPFGTPAEGWREAARFLRRTARDSGDRQGVLHGARLIEAELRRLADESGPCVAGEQQNETPEAETVHGCPPDGSGLTPCCGRTPFELPLTDRISSEAPVTCPSKEA